MRRALALAKNGVGLTSPNPAVGAVIVKNGEELAGAWHRASGQPHAEREAIALAKARNLETRGATIYVTLEPCSTHGRTGACTDALIEADFQRVVYGCFDPNPNHAGKADRFLQAAGIKVNSSILKNDCQNLIRGFSSVQQRRRPWLIMKSAMSLDGRLTRPPGESQWLTNPASREVVQLLRAEVDAIITSGETIRRDNPALNLRSPAIPSSKKQPWRVIISQFAAEKFSEYQVCQDEHRSRTLFFPPNHPKSILENLTKNYDCQTVLLESGGRLNGIFLDAKLVDEAMLFYAPMVCGGDIPAIGGEGVTDYSQAWNLEKPSLQILESDLCVRGILSKKTQVISRAKTS